jgi:hypothetical protein
VASALLERETLTREDINFLIRGEKIPPPKTPPTAPATPVLPPVAEPRRANPPLLGGPEVAPA